MQYPPGQPPYGNPPGGQYPPPPKYGAGQPMQPYAAQQQPMMPYQPPPGAAQPPGGFSDKSIGTAFLLSFFLGWLGVDRFYLGYTGLGILKLLTCGGCGIWILVDCILIGGGSLKDSEGRTLTREPVYGTPRRSQMTTKLLALLVPYFSGGLAAGADRLYLGYTGLGILKCLTCGGFGIWSLIDTILIGMGKLRDADGNSLNYDKM